MPAPDGLALLIGKRLDKKGGKDGPESLPMGDEEDPGEEMGKESVENSAISDFMAAKDPETAKAALKQFLEACYPSLAGEGEEESAEGEY
jgi:hypothetical protein